MSAVVEIRDIVKRYGAATAVDGLSFAVEQGECLSLLGPSGCGKTTTLRVIAGFEQVERGAVLIDGRDVLGKRAYERNIGLVFQDYALFPHMTVEENVAYGMKRRNVERGEMATRLRDMLALVKLSGYETRRPRQLSGGEQQRVALARALVTRPAVMLLDEPLSNLDAKLRNDVRAEIKEILGRVGTTTIIVTHDQEEAMSMADTIVVMNRGRLMQRGTPDEIYGRPANRFTADFVGRMNWFSGRASHGGTIETADGIVLRVPTSWVAPGAEFDLGVRPERIALMAAEESAAPTSNVLAGTVAMVESLGSDRHYRIDLGAGRRMLVVEKNDGRGPRPPGSAVALRFAPESCIVLPAEGPAAPGLSSIEGRGK